MNLAVGLLTVSGGWVYVEGEFRTVSAGNEVQGRESTTAGTLLNCSEKMQHIIGMRSGGKCGRWLVKIVLDEGVTLERKLFG